MVALVETCVETVDIMMESHPAVSGAMDLLPKTVGPGLSFTFGSSGDERARAGSTACIGDERLPCRR